MRDGGKFENELKKDKRKKKEVKIKKLKLN